MSGKKSKGGPAPNEGFIPWLLSKHIPASQREPYKWHLALRSALDKTEEYRGSTLVIDLKPQKPESNLSLYELTDVYGYSDAGWTPILFRLSGLFVDEDPRRTDRKDFFVEDGTREEPLYECLHMEGTVSSGKLVGKLTAPKAGPTNAVVLWPEVLKYFFYCVRRRDPNLLD